MNTFTSKAPVPLGYSKVQPGCGEVESQGGGLQLLHGPAPFSGRKAQFVPRTQNEWSLLLNNNNDSPILDKEC